MKKPTKNLSANGHLNSGVKHQKCSHHARPSQKRKTYEPGKKNCVYGSKKDTLQQFWKASNHHQEVPQSRQLHLKRSIRSDDDSETTWRHPKSGRLNMDMEQVLHSHADPYQIPCSSNTVFHHQNLPYNLPGVDMGSMPTTINLHPFRSYADTVTMPALQHQGFNNRNANLSGRSNPSYNFGRGNLNHFI